MQAIGNDDEFKKLTQRTWSLDAIGFHMVAPWTSAGEIAAQDQLTQFASKIEAYGNQRDYPALNATSTLSAHFRFGTLSIREACRVAIANESEGTKKNG